MFLPGVMPGPREGDSGILSKGMALTHPVNRQTHYLPATSFVGCNKKGQYICWQCSAYFDLNPTCDQTVCSNMSLLQRSVFKIWYHVKKIQCRLCDVSSHCKLEKQLTRQFFDKFYNASLQTRGVILLSDLIFLMSLILSDMALYI